MKRLAIILALSATAAFAQAQPSIIQGDTIQAGIAAPAGVQSDYYRSNVTQTTDSVTTPVSILGQHAWSQATGANRTGGTLYLGGGVGSTFYTVVTYASTSGKTVTITGNGSSTTLTEGTSWQCVSAGSNNACATNLATAINANGTISAYLTATANGASVYLDPKKFLYTGLTIATNAGAPLTATMNAASGVTASPLTTPSVTSPASTDLTLKAPSSGNILFFANGVYYARLTQYDFTAGPTCYLGTADINNGIAYTSALTGGGANTLRFGTATVKGAYVVTADANGGSSGHTSGTELLTLSTSGTTTNTSASLATANSVVDAILARVTTTITTATDWSVSVTSGIASCTTAWVAIGTTTSAQTGLIAGTTVIFKPASGLVCHVGTASTLTVTTTGTPGAGVIRLTPILKTYTAPTS